MGRILYFPPRHIDVNEDNFLKFHHRYVVREETAISAERAAGFLEGLETRHKTTLKDFNVYNASGNRSPEYFFRDFDDVILYNLLTLVTLLEYVSVLKTLRVEE
jgi:hypothetical protein